MEIKKIVFGWAVILIGLGTSFAQSKKIDRTHLISASATFSPAFFLKGGVSSNYLNGFIEYYPQANVSLKSEAYLFLRPPAEKGHPLRQNTGIVFGGLYHLNKNGAFDPYIGFQPGVSFVTYYPDLNGQIQYFGLVKNEIVPVVSVSIGANYYVSRYFNFFGSIRYVRANGVQTESYFTDLSEIRFSFGLGFNFAQNKGCNDCPSFDKKKK